jgi:hypothetical protein
MSVINFIQEHDRIYLITDGIIHGKPQVTNKVASLPHLNCAVAAFANVGAGAVLPIFATALGQQCQTFEAAILFAVEVLRDCQRDFPALVPTPKTPAPVPTEPHFSLTVAGLKFRRATARASPTSRFSISREGSSHAFNRARPAITMS